MRHLLSPAILACIVGCTEGEPPGHYFDVELSLNRDECNAVAVGYSESLRYQVVFDDTNISVGVAGDLFATGSQEGCTANYSSVIWTETRDAGDLRWMLTGEAQVQRGGTSCGTAADWIGTETFTIMSSEDPDIQAGCEYVVNVVGTYTGEVE